MAETYQTESSAVVSCPCCKGLQPEAEAGLFRCRVCLHRWQAADSKLTLAHYASQVDRNALPQAYVQSKLDERLQYLTASLESGQCILEIGCAEGALGAMIKSRFDVKYVGLELSRDAEAARQLLDQVVERPEQLPEARFDLLLAFHVLEHIPDVNEALLQWTKLLKPSGKLIIEIPNQAGHPWLQIDRNKEHLHQFNTASLGMLLRQHGLALKSLETGVFESPTYPDSIRIMAMPEIAEQQRSVHLVSALEKTIDGPFDIFAVGGDFISYIQPVLEALPVETLFDNSASNHIAGREVQPFSLEENAGRAILISSVRYEESIRSQLIASGVAEHKIYCLSQILMQVTTDD